jgi:septum formation protein
MAQPHPASPPSPSDAPSLVLGSTSRYRQALLARLRLPFDVDAPHVDETPLPDELPSSTARRLALAKANEVARRRSGAVVIGADQVAELDGQAIGKPLTHDRAVDQLRTMSGRRVVFHSAVAVVRQDTGFSACGVAQVQVSMRRLSDPDIERYLRLDQPYDCAGSAKCESLGIVLVDSIVSDDPTALEGLPLILTCRWLREAGIDLLSSPHA